MIRPSTQPPEHPSPVLPRRDVLKLAALTAAGAALAPILAACSASTGTATPPGPGRRSGQAAPRSGSITALVEGGDPLAEPALKKVFDDFKAANPGIEWDIRGIPGLGPDWDRLARAALASGEPVGLIMIDGLFVRAWQRDGLLGDLEADPGLADVLARVPDRYRLGGLDDSGTRAFPLAASRGIQTTGLYYNKALLDRAGLEPPTTISDMKAMLGPLAALGASPLVHPAGDVPFNPLLVMWLLPMIAGRGGDPIAFVERTVKGTIRYDSPEWTEAFATIAELATSGVLHAGSGATDYLAMQQIFLQGKAAMTYNGTWLLPSLQAGMPTAPFELHVAPLPLVDGAAKSHSTLAWTGFAIPAVAPTSNDGVNAFLEYASRPTVDEEVVEGLQTFSPIAASNAAIHDPVEREFLPMLDGSITSLNWLWEPEIDVEIGNQVQALVTGGTDPATAGAAVEAVANELRSSGRSYYR